MQEGQGAAYTMDLFAWLLHSSARALLDQDNQEMRTMRCDHDCG
jgi:hypothetical protein